MSHSFTTCRVGARDIEPGTQVGPKATSGLNGNGPRGSIGTVDRELTLKVPHIYLYILRYYFCLRLQEAQIEYPSM